MNTCKSWMLLFLEDGGIYTEFVWIIPCPAQSWFDIHYNNLTHRLTTALHSSCGHLYIVFSAFQLSYRSSFSRQPSADLELVRLLLSQTTLAELLDQLNKIPLGPA